MKIGLLDFETTGLNREHDDIISGVIGAFEYERSIKGADLPRVPDFKKDLFYTRFNEPNQPIPMDVQKLTGLTPEMVKAYKFDWSEFKRIAQECDLLLAHNCKFDRSFVRRIGGYDGGKWGCSLEMVDWEAQGLKCKMLGHLLFEHGVYPGDGYKAWGIEGAAHDCVTDIQMMKALLLQALKVKDDSGSKLTYLDELIDRADQMTIRVSATGAKFHSKDILKGRGYRWNPDSRVWYKDIVEGDAETERVWLGDNVYRMLIIPADFKEVDPTL